jgi:DNA-binding IclR family transcriptional regulator
MVEPDGADTSSDESSGGVQVIARVANLFRAFEGEQSGLTLSELAKRLSLPRSTVHRLVGSLVAEGLLVTDSTAGRVRIGPEFVRIAATSRLELRQRAQPYMREIFDAVGETVDCSILESDRARVIEVLSSQHQLRAQSDIGATFPLHCTSKGLAMLSQLPDDKIEELLPKTLERFTSKTVTTRAQLHTELEQVRRTGVAFDEEQHDLGICAVAIGMTDPFGLLFAISVPVPSQRYTEAKDAIVETLLDVRERIVASMAG